tara:strand:+ start:128 stop:676 length:549 start_codon:yes stop_codon:yes gene_type:complete
MTKAYDIIQGISQVAANCYDGAYDEKGEPYTIGGKGLKREIGHPVLDSRLVDGFKVKIGGDRLYVTYQSDVKLKEVHGKDFENDMNRTVEDVAKYIKKSYKKLTGESLSLTDPSEVNVLVQSTSRVRVFAVATKSYKIGGLSEVNALDAEDSERNRYESDFKSFLEKGGWGKRPKNDDRKKQ